MKLFLLVVLSGLGFVQTGVRAAERSLSPGQAVVTFVSPENFTDSSDDAAASAESRQQVLSEIRAQFELLAKRYLREGQQLELTVTDVDLAGAYEPWRGMDFDHLRILRDIYPPSMQLSFLLLGPEGKVIAEGTRRLRDFGYLQFHAMPSSDPLRYEKDMIGLWMKTEFGRRS